MLQCAPRRAPRLWRTASRPTPLPPALCSCSRWSLRRCPRLVVRARAAGPHRRRHRGCSKRRAAGATATGLRRSIRGGGRRLAPPSHLRPLRAPILVPTVTVRVVRIRCVVLIVHRNLFGTASLAASTGCPECRGPARRGRSTRRLPRSRGAALACDRPARAAGARTRLEHPDRDNVTGDTLGVAPRSPPMSIDANECRNRQACEVEARSRRNGAPILHG